MLKYGVLWVTSKTKEMLWEMELVLMFPRMAIGEDTGQ
jgi:hypothetical protein